MNNNLLEELIRLHDACHHDQIIQIIEKLPADELNYEVKGLLACAYNNIEVYDKALEILLKESDQGTHDPLWNFRVGYAFFNQEEDEKALPYFQKSYELGEDDAYIFILDCMENIEESKRVKPSQQPVTVQPSEQQKIDDITLNEIAWMFSSKRYTNAGVFCDEVAAYQKDLYGTDEKWKPEEIVSDFPELQIHYMAWVSQPSDLLENETLIEEDKSVFEEYPDEEEYQVEILAKLKADNAKNFSALEFLMKAHNQQANKELGDHVFFEGTDTVPKITNGLPTYYIACGS